MNDNLRNHLLGRRLVLAGVVTVLTGLFFGGMVGFAAAGEPATHMPQSFGVPAPRVGDEGVYNATVVEREGETFRDLDPERPAVAFEWMPPREILDATGEPRRVNEFRHGQLQFYGGTDTGFLRLQDEDLADMGPQVIGFDAATGRIIATGFRSDPASPNEEFHTILIPPDGESGELPLCGLIHPLQGKNHSTKDRVALFSQCDTPAGNHASTDFKAATTDTIGGRECIVYARTNWIGWATGDGEEAYVWLCEGVPYPLRILVEDPSVPDRFVIYRLTGMTEGTRPLAGPDAEPMRDAAPGLEWAPRQSVVLLSEAGLVHPFPLSAAVARASAEPGSSAVRDFQRDHPAAYVQQAHYAENQNAGATERYWWFILGDDQDWIAVGLVQRDTGLTRSYRYDNQTAWADDLLAGEPFLPPARLPAQLPTVDSLRKVWLAYKSAAKSPEPFGWSFSIAPQHFWCRADSDPDECTPSVTVTVGRMLRHDAIYFPGREAPTDYSFIRVVPDPETKTHLVAAFSENRVVDPTWRAPGNVDDTQLLAMSLDIGVWTWPTGRFAVGAGVLALLVGFAYWSWPVVKSAVGLGLFSRVERPRALEHPSRAQLAALVDANPGIHFQEIRRRLGWSAGLARHHIGKLVELGLLTERITAGYTCYFPQGKIDRRVMDAMPYLKAEGARRILAFILANPGAAGVDVSRATKLDAATVHYHIQRLADAGLLELHREGREVRARAAEVAPAALGIAG